MFRATTLSAAALADPPATADYVGAGADEEFFFRELTLDEKLALAAEHRNGYGLNACRRALGIFKGIWHYRMRQAAAMASVKGSRNEKLKAHIVEIIRANPACGY